MTTMAERWLAEGYTEEDIEGLIAELVAVYVGRVRGRPEARLEGRLQGRLEGRRAALRLVLTKKFGELPEHAQQRIETASEEALWLWTGRVLSESSLYSLLSD
jgi:hypothetical protein